LYLSNVVLNPYKERSYAMISQFFMPAFKRQKEVMPQAIQDLEALAKTKTMTQSGVYILQRITHDLRNQLTVVSVVIEIHENEAMGHHTL
jgi:UDP-3-O-[3-hydroxymyristoyl] glucosamine N-acyltransferase